MILGYKVKLLPNNKQKTELMKNFGISRWAYNWTINRQQENYQNGNKFLSNYELRKELTQLKKIEEFSWLNNYSNDIVKQAIKDACKTYKKFFDKKSGYPNFKKKKEDFSFYMDTHKIEFSNTCVKLEKISKTRKGNKQKLNWIKLSEYNRIHKDIKYYNPRVTFDGINFYISLSVEKEDNLYNEFNDNIGIDVGIKDTAICSDGFIYKNINKTDKLKKLEKRKKRKQRKISKKYELNKQGEKFTKTNNIRKEELRLKKIQNKINNIKKNYLHHVTKDIIERKPSSITIETLSIQEMMKTNRSLARQFQEQGLYEFQRQVKYKGIRKGIEIRVANKYFPSSRMCNVCKTIKNDLTLNDRYWLCEHCGTVHNRDVNASINLRDCDEYEVYKEVS